MDKSEIVNELKKLEAKRKYYYSHLLSTNQKAVTLLDPFTWDQITEICQKYPEAWAWSEYLRYKAKDNGVLSLPEYRFGGH